MSPYRDPSAFRRSLIVLLASVASLVASVPRASGQEVDLDSWLSVSSRNFVMITDASPERAADLIYSLEIFRNTFAGLSPQLELRSVVPTTFIAFRDRTSYAPYKSVPDSQFGSILGQFLIHTDRNFLTLNANARVGTDFAVIYHEFVHYLVAHNFARVPRWFHEGLAEYYSTFAIEGDMITLGRPVARHVSWLRADSYDRGARSLSHDFSLRDVLTGDSGSHRSRAGGFYAMSWMLVHYLLSGGPERLDQLADFLVRLNDGEDPDDAFERALNTRLDDIEETLRSYAFATPLPTSGARPEVDEAFPVATVDLAAMEPRDAPVLRRLAAPDVLFHLGNLSLRLGRVEIAEQHYQAALDRDPEHAEALAGLALLHALAGRVDEAEVLFRDALKIGSSDALTYLRYGRSLLAKMAPEAAIDFLIGRGLPVSAELLPPNTLTRDGTTAALDELAAAARKAFEKAVELDRDFAEPQVLLGYSHIFGEVEPKAGIAALQKARSWLPDRDELRIFLLQLYLKGEKFDEARRLGRGLEDLSTDAVGLWAREEIERSELLHAAGEAFLLDEVDDALGLFDEAISVTSDQDLRDRMAERLGRLQEALRQGTLPQETLPQETLPQETLPQETLPQETP